MKTTLKTLGSLLLLGLITLSARATIVLQENFDSASIGALTNYLGNTYWIGHSGAGVVGVSASEVVADASVSSPNALLVSQARAQDVNAKLTNQPYAVPAGGLVGTNVLGNPITALYGTFTISVVTLPTGGNTYFAHFYQNSSTFFGKLFIITNGVTPGFYRLAVQNNISTGTNTIPIDLSLNTVYTNVTRYVLSSGVTTLWLNPTNETSSPNVNATDTPTPGTVTAYGFRQAGSEGVIDVDNLVVGTSFADVVPGSVNPPVIVTQPQDTNAFAGNSMTFKTLAVGDANLAYQWYYNTNTPLVDSGSVSGATSNVLTLTGLTAGQAGTYSAVVTNNAGTNVTRFATLVVNTVPIPPVITNQPVDFTTTVGDTATFAVVAGGSTPLVYQWKVDDGAVTNNASGPNISGANGPTLTITSVTTSLTGLKYFVSITNAFGATNSAKATLTVNPPSLGNISGLHALINPTTFAPSNTTILYKVRGIVTTWSDMTGPANTLFYMQDDSGGIPVFWLGAPSPANLPPAGALVEVVAPLTSFNGLLEIQPVFNNSLHSVTVISTGNPLPKAQPLPFDPFITTNTPVMKKLEGSYFVASNVFLANGATFVSGSNEGITNIATQTKSFTNSVLNLLYTNASGQSFTMFVNASTDIPGQAKPSGPVTIYGVLGFFTAVGFEFTASRYADIIVPTQFTNVLSNVTRSGDLLTNSFKESVLRTNETLTMNLTVSDPGGSSVTIAPSSDGLPASASWDGAVNGAPATAKFHFTPTPSDAGNNYVVGLGYTINGVTSSNYWYIYVPTPDEQQMYISEFLANPTTNTGASYFNPLHRSVDATNITTWDQYVEIANVSGATFDLYGWSITDASQTRHTFLIGAPTEQLGSSSAVVVYGGGKVGDPSPPNLSVSAFPANIGGSPSLSLAKSGRGVIVLRNPGYYNNALGNKPGYIVDRVVYNSSDLNNGSLSRFPTLNGALVPQAYISTRTNFTTAGLQYDGGPWSAPTQTPASVGNIVITAGNPVNLSFTANTNNGTTLWVANSLNDKFSVVFGNQFTNAAAQFQITNPPSTMQFYFITTQTNYLSP